MKDINIAEILKAMPKGTKLYSSICGECELVDISSDFNKKSITVKETTNTGAQHSFWHDGKFFKAGECVLQPGKHMDDWTKITWKKGDVLVSRDSKYEVIFDHFTNDYYSFVGKHLLYTTESTYSYVSAENTFVTANYSIEDRNAAQCYINTIEERFEGKLNPDTLDIEKEEEHNFKPFEKVLARNCKEEPWHIDFFEKYKNLTAFPYACMTRLWAECIPYEGNEHLLGTTNNPEKC